MKSHSTRSVTIIALILLIGASPSVAQRRSTSINLRDGREVRTAFQSVVAAANQSTVRVVCAGKETVLGTVVDADGWIVTKYSELREPIVCRLADGRQLPAKVVGHDPQFDLAMLKITATGLKAVEWSEDEKGPVVGQLLASAAPGDLPQAIGVVSVPQCAIRLRTGPLRAQLGVRSSDENVDGAKIGAITPESAAAKAGLQVGDIVIRVDGKAIDSWEKLSETISQHDPGDQLVLIVRRGNEQVSLNATLTKPGPELLNRGGPSRSDRMNAMGSELSKLASGFPAVIQHDTVLQSSECGGPLVDLLGKVVGINIARAGRVESYAVPADRVRALVSDMETGKLAVKDPLPGAKPVMPAEKKVEETKVAE